ncbi:GAF domain-containing protein [Akkermansiaceae bacterium]|nr:GAF domain-containing protein [Akkermansiaceae bacterium]
MSASKSERYARAKERIRALCEGELDEIALMASVVGVLHHEMEGFFWTGFYRVIDGGLVIGPYQGPVGCLRIAFGKGVCGTAAETGETQVVPDVHAFLGHIACDARSKSEIVVPLRNREGELTAVLDIDSEELRNFDEVDRGYLEEILSEVFS